MIMMNDPVKLVAVKPTAHDIYTGTRYHPKTTIAYLTLTLT